MVSDRLQQQIDVLLDEAEAAIKQLDWRVVHDRAQALLGIDPKNAERLAFLSTADRALGGATPPPQITEPPTSQPATALTMTPAQATSFANGRHQVARFLGEGGKKKVYLAHDTLLGTGVIGSNWSGPAATMSTCCWSVMGTVTAPRRRPCWTSPWPSTASWASVP